MLGKNQEERFMSVLCISRQFGAGGKTLGQRLAKRLGWTFVYNDVLIEVAKEAKVSTEWVEAVEKEAGDWLMRFVNKLVATDFIERHLGDNLHDFDENRYRQFLGKVINSVADRGDAVILGRGAQFILANRTDAFRVLLVASHEDRIKFMMDHYNMTKEKAEHLVEKEVKRRTRFVETMGVKEPDDPCHYHLVLNTSILDLDQAESLVMCMISDMSKLG
jgi:cytidylate kinase